MVFLNLKVNEIMDTTAITGAITLALTAIGVVGAAVMSVHVAVKAFKWVRAAMS